MLPHLNNNKDFNNNYALSLPPHLFSSRRFQKILSTCVLVLYGVVKVTCAVIPLTELFTKMGWVGGENCELETLQVAAWTCHVSCPTLSRSEEHSDNIYARIYKQNIRRQGAPTNIRTVYLYFYVHICSGQLSTVG